MPDNEKKLLEVVQGINQELKEGRIQQDVEESEINERLKEINERLGEVTFALRKQGLQEREYMGLPNKGQQMELDEVEKLFVSLGGHREKVLAATPGYNRPVPPR